MSGLRSARQARRAHKKGAAAQLYEARDSAAATIYYQITEEGIGELPGLQVCGGAP